MGQTSRCALIIADGREDALLPGRFESRDATSTMIQYVLDSVWTVVDEILVIFQKEPPLELIETIAPFGVKVAVDERSRDTLSKVVVGMLACNSENCLVATVSRPFVKPNVIFRLFEAVGSHDAAVPRWADNRQEPLLAVYRKKPFLKAASKERGGGIESVIDDLCAVTFVQIEETLKPLDPDLLSFFRVRTDADFTRAATIALAQEVR